MSDISNNNDDTSNIDNKKTENSKKNKEMNIQGSPSSFVKSLFCQLINLTVIIIIGLFFLYSVKVSQANIMPTDVNCEPYDINKTVIEAIDINVDVMKYNENGKTISRSTKINFPYNENINILKNSVLGINYLKEWKYNENTNAFYIYLSTIISELYANNFNILNNIYKMLNQSCNETAIVFLTPLFFIFVVILLLFVNNIYFVYLSLFKLYLLFSVKSEYKRENVLDENGTPKMLNNIGIKETINKWTYEKGTIYNKWYYAIIYLIVIYVLLFLFLFIIPIIPLTVFIVTMKSLLLPLLMVANVSNVPNEKYSLKNLCLNFLKNRMNVLMYIVSFFVVIDAYTSIGNFGLLISILACVFIYIFFPQIYKKQVTNNPTSTNGLSSYKEASKKCIIEDFNGIKYGRDKIDSWIEWGLSFFKPYLVETNNVLNIINKGEELKENISNKSIKKPFKEEVSDKSIKKPFKEEGQEGLEMSTTNKTKK